MGRLKPVKRWVRFHILRALFGTISLLPRRWGLGIFGFLGDHAFRILPGPRDQIIANTRLIYPDWAEEERTKFARRVMRSIGRNAIDFVRLPRYTPGDIGTIADFEGSDRLRRCLEKGKGVIGLSAHMGCWELVPLLLRAEGFEIGVVYRRSSDPLLERYITSRRQRMGVTTHDRDADARGILRKLQSNAIVGLLIDVRTRVDSVKVPFLGRPAWTPLGAARLAMRTGAPVVPILGHMRPDGRHSFRVGEEVAILRPRPHADREDVRRAEEENTARCNEVLGKLLEENIEQWAWVHPRWDVR